MAHWSARCPGAIPRGARFGRPAHEAKFALLHAQGLGRVREFWHFACHLTSPPHPTPEATMARLERALPRCDTARCALRSAWT
jgi:hypothetical protein